MGEGWQAKEEQTNLYWLTALWWVCRIAGRELTRKTLLVAITSVYFLIDRSARKVSRQYLARVYDRPVSALDVFKHMYTFATVSMDRLFILSGRENIFEVEMTGEEIFDDLDQGAILVTSHFGSFEIMRVLGKNVQDLTIHILLDKHHNAQTLQFLRHLNPEMADQIVDAGTPGPQLVVELSNLLTRGRLVGIMADRILPGQRTMQHPFLGAPADFPLGPWAIAVILQRPLVYCFGTYKGGRRYSITFERFDPAGLTGRTVDKSRAAASNYIERLQHYVRADPLNWFNFYDFWSGTANDSEKTDSN